MQPDVVELHRRLHTIQNDIGIRSKGPLSLAVMLTRRARDEGLPITDDALVTDGGGQVRGAGMGATQSILREHGIDRVLSKEGGRTSRGSLSIARAYAEALNALHRDGLADLARIEAWWIDRVREYFAASPFRLGRVEARSMRSLIGDVLDQARAREREAGQGATITGTVLQHLVGAKFEILYPGTIRHHGANVADDPSRRAGDFLVGQSAVHVTTMPTDGLIRRCGDNRDAGLHPVIITLDPQTAFAEELARRAALLEFIDILGATTFLGANLLETARFRLSGSATAIDSLLSIYNNLVQAHETDPSLRIELVSPARTLGNQGD